MDSKYNGQKAGLDSVELREILALDNRRREHIFPTPHSSISQPKYPVSHIAQYGISKTLMNH
jgi:hypothetical protein